MTLVNVLVPWKQCYLAGSSKPLSMVLSLENEPQHEISNNVVCAASKGPDQSSDQSLYWSLEYSMPLRPLTEHHLEFLHLKEAVQARLSLHLSKYHIVGSHMSLLKYT